LSQRTGNEISTLCDGGQLLKSFYTEYTNAAQVKSKSLSEPH